MRWVYKHRTLRFARSIGRQASGTLRHERVPGIVGLPETMETVHCPQNGDTLVMKHLIVFKLG